MGEQNSERILRDYLTKVHRDYLSCGLLSDVDIKFLAEFCIVREETSGNKLLKLEKYKSLPLKSTEYFGETDHLTIQGEIKSEIQKIYKRFNTKKDNANKDGMKFFDDKFEDFLDWWISEMYVNGKHYCCYCGVDEDIVMAAFDKKLISSTKKSFSRELQIERLDPNGGYNRKNCKFACAVCNNAKSDMFKTPDSFIKYFKPHRGIRDFWYDTKEQIENMNKTDK